MDNLYTSTVLDPPGLKNIIYTGAIIKASWENAIGSGNNFQVTLFENNQPKTSANAIGTAGIIYNIQIDITKTYTVRVAQTDTTYTQIGSYSNEIEVIAATPENIQIEYNGTEMALEWSMPAGIPIQGGSISLFEKSQFLLISNMNFDGCKAVFKPDHPLNPSLNYCITISGFNPGSLGPNSAPIDIVQDSIQLTSVSYTGNTLIGTGDKSASDLLLPTLYLYADRQLINSTPSTMGNRVIMPIANSLVPWQHYEARLAYTNGSSRGPLSTPMQVLSNTPILNYVSYNGISLKAVWNNLPTAITPTGGRMLLFQGNTLIDNFDVLGNEGVWQYSSDKFDPELQYSLSICSTYGPSSGPNSTPINIIQCTKSVSSVQYDGEKIIASWLSDSNPAITGYRISLLDSGGAVIASQNSGNSRGIINYCLDSEENYNLSLQATGNNTAGPASSCPVISSVPGIKQITADNDHIYVSIDDSRVSGCSGVTSCAAFLYEGQTQVLGPVSGCGTPPTAVFNYTLQAQYSYSVRIQAAGTNCLGPLSDSEAIIASAPTIINTHYNGSVISVSWTRVTSSAVTGYSVTLTPTVSPDKALSFQTDATSIDIPLDSATANGTYSVSVCAISKNSTGPSSAAVDPVNPGFYLSSEPDKAPAVKPASNVLPCAASTIEYFLPELYSTVPQVLPSAGPFALTAVNQSNGFKYKIGFTADSDVWKFDNLPIRTTLQNQYQNFLLALEGKLENQDPSTIGTILQGSVQIVAEAIARIIPQTFEETLYYNYGLFPTNNYVDLKPGMRLRIEYQQWQTVSNSAPQYVNGYTGNGAVEYDIGTYINSTGSLKAGFNAFLSSLNVLYLADPKGGKTGPYDGGGGGIDLFFQDFRKPLYRMFYPGTFSIPSYSGSGNLKDNVIIVAAADWFTLCSITNTILNGGIGTLPAIGTNYAILYMRGRAVLTPLICISVNGERIWTPVGTTLGQIMEQSASRPFNIQASIQGLRYMRVGGNMFTNITDQTPTFTAYNALPIHFDWGKCAVYSNSSSWVSLPVLSGDYIDFMEDR